MTLTLSPGREARRDLAIWAALDAHEAGDQALLRQRCEEVVSLNQRLYAEQRAEHGHLPDTIDGCIAVLGVAERLLALFLDPDEEGGLF